MSYVHVYVIVCVYTFTLCVCRQANMQAGDVTTFTISMYSAIQQLHGTSEKVKTHSCGEFGWLSRSSEQKIHGHKIASNAGRQGASQQEHARTRLSCNINMLEPEMEAS